MADYLAGSVTAQLRLDLTEFTKDIDAALTKLNSFSSDSATSLSKTNSQITKLDKTLTELSTDSNKASEGTRTLVTIINNLDTAIKRLDENTGIKSLNTMSNAIKKLTEATRSFSTDTVNMDSAITTIISGIQQYGNAIGGVNVNIRNASSSQREYASTTDSIYGSVRRVTSAETEMENAFRRLKTEFSGAKIDVEGFNNIVPNTASGVERLKQEFLQLSQGVERYNSIQPRATSLMREYGTMTYSTRSAVESYKTTHMELPTTNTQVAEAIQRIVTSMREEATETERTTSMLSQYKAQAYQIMADDEALATAKQQLATATNEASTSLQREAVASEESATAMNSAKSATTGLASAMSSLKMMVSMVGSLFAWNFAHNLYTATSDTIKMRSEMYSMFETMGMGKGSIDDFNSALDETAERFQRINKYALGETVSSIGVEFDLTTEEMKKALDITSMVTNEYVRAGRTAEEASLAVKDVMQGEFQRLSRETGVKGEQLKEAGWNGDNTDVMSLMEALEKVAHDRNWDTFAEKANSLSDIVTITQNRISEAIADVSDRYIPIIVDTFNIASGVITRLSEGLMGAFEWLDGNSWEQQAVKIGLVVTAIGGLLGAMVSWRTGAGLLEIAQMGLKDSLTATVFGLEAETVAQYGSTKALTAKITGYEAETVANIGSWNALKAKLLGLDAEALKTKGVAGAIDAKIASMQLDTTTTTANSTATTVNNGTIEINTDSLTTNTMVKGENTLATEMETVATEEATVAEGGFFTALVATIGGMTMAEAETLSLAGSIGVLSTAMLTSPMFWFVAAIGAVAGAVYYATGEIRDQCDALKEYNSILDNAEGELQVFYDSQAILKQEYEDALEKVNNTSYGTAEYDQAMQDAEEASRNYEQAQRDLAEAIDLVNEASDLKKEYPAQKQSTTSSTTAQLRTQMENQGFTDEQVNNNQRFFATLRTGTDTYTHALEVWNMQNQDMLAGENKLVTNLDKHKVDKTEQLQWVTDYESAYNDLIDASERANTADNIWDWAGASWDAGWAQKKIDMIEFMSDFSIDDLFSGIGDSADWFLDALGLKNIDVGKVFDGLGDFFQGSFDAGKWLGELMGGHISVSDFINKLFNFEIGGVSLNDILKPITDLFSDIDVDSLLEMFKLPDIGIGDFLDKIFSPDNDPHGKGVAKKVDTSWISNAVNEYIAQPLMDFINDPLGSLGLPDFDIGKLFDDLFNGASDSLDSANQFVQDNIITPISDTLSDFVNDPLGFMEDVSFSMVDFVRGLLGIEEEGDPESVDVVKTWIHNTIFKPIEDFLNDPLGSLGLEFPSFEDIMAELLGLDGTEDLEAVQLKIQEAISEMITPEFLWNLVDTNIIQPLGQSISDGIANIPIVGDILQMLGLIDGTDSTAGEKGTGVADAFKQTLEEQVRNIPIVGDVLQMLGVIDSATPTASSKGNAVGSNIKSGVETGKSGTSQLVKDEVSEIITALSNKIGEARRKAEQIGSAILGGINSVIQHHSPGIPAQLIFAEMEEIAWAMDDNIGNVYSSAQGIGNAITNGIQPNTSFDLDSGAVEQYQTDVLQAMQVANTTAVGTENAFTGLDGSTSQIFTNMDSTITSTFTNIAATTSNNYTQMGNVTKTQLTNMQSQTTKNINSIKTSWNGMQTALIASAENIRSQTGQKINQLESNMGTFWRKVQNPALLLGGSAGSPEEATGVRRSRPVGLKRSVSSKLGFAGTPNLTPKSTGISSKFKAPRIQSVDMYDAMEEMFELLSQSKPAYAGWNFNWTEDIRKALLTWHTHFGQIYDPYLYVGKFENDNFPVRGIAPIAKNYIYDAISRTTYDFYFNSKYGSPLAAWNAGSFNCYDGALLVLALANAFGFSGSMVHGSWNGIPHVWARINGIGDIDSTAIQGGYGFTSPKVTGAGSPSKSSDVDFGNTTNNKITIVVNVNGDSEDKGLGKRIGEKVREEIIDLFSPNGVTGA